MTALTAASGSSSPTARHARREVAALDQQATVAIARTETAAQLGRLRAHAIGFAAAGTMQSQVVLHELANQLSIANPSLAGRLQRTADVADSLLTDNLVYTAQQIRGWR